MCHPVRVQEDGLLQSAFRASGLRILASEFGVCWGFYHEVYGARLRVASLGLRVDGLGSTFILCYILLSNNMGGSRNIQKTI